MKKKYTKFYLHVLCWILLISYHILTTYLFSKEGFKIPAINIIVVHIFVHIPIFYFSYFFIFKLYEKHKNWILLIVTIAICFSIYLFLQLQFYNYFLLRDNPSIKQNFTISFVADVIDEYFLYYFLYAFIYWYAQKSIKKERALRIAETEKIKLKYEQLKAQVNPHFLYNTLNLFYTKTAASQPELAEGIEQLTSIMRYSLTASNNPGGKALLTEEIENTMNLIKLHQLRYRNSLHIDFTQTGNTEGLYILPHALITLTENALKYGLMTDVAAPVTLRLTVTGNQLEFITENNVRENIDRSANTGTGLANLQQRLAQEYGKGFSFTHHAEKDYFTTLLKINL